MCFVKSILKVSLVQSHIKSGRCTGKNPPETSVTTWKEKTSKILHMYLIIRLPGSSGKERSE
jgi:hypothetical protein